MRHCVLAIFAMLLGSIPLGAKACDACNLFSGVTPMDLKSQAGLFFRYRTFHGFNYSDPSGADGTNKTQHGPDGHPVPGPDGQLPDVRESYFRAAVNLRFFFKDRWNFQASLPVTYNFEIYGDERKSGQGMGDINMMVNYGLLVGGSDRQAWRVFVGAGLKLPSGWRFRRLQDRQTYPDIQGGTGSLDLLLQTEASWRIGKHGLNGNAVLRLNTRNGEQTRYGHFFNATLNYFHQIDWPGLNSRLLPYAGAFLESYSGRYEAGTRVAHTGGTVVFANTGLSWFVDRYSFRPQVQIPVVQQLRGFQLLNKPIISCEASVAF